MKMTRRHFALSIAVASGMGSSLFGSTLSPLGVPRRSSRPSHLGPRSGGCDLGSNRFLMDGRQQQPGCN
jgi:hypothetical protein